MARAYVGVRWFWGAVSVRTYHVRTYAGRACGARFVSRNEWVPWQATVEVQEP